MLRSWLLNTRKKPKHARDRVAFVAAGSFTAAVLLVWLATAPGALMKNVAEKSEGPKAFSTFFNQLKEQVAGVKEALPDKQIATTTTEINDQNNRPVELTATSSAWKLSSSTVEARSVHREVPIMIVKNGSSTATSSKPERSL